MNLAPNGKPSNLTPEQYKLVRTKAFKDWFGDWENDSANASKIVDENGEPLVVYHGSKSNEEFNVFKQSSRFEFIYFAKTKEYAWFHFTKDIIDKPFQLRPFFLNIRNLLNGEEYGFEKVDFSELESFFYGIHELSKDIQLNPKSQYRFWEVLRFSNDIYDSLKNEDYYDGISFYENFYDNTTWNDTDDYSLSYVVMNPNQIKLADGSNTTFDSNNPDIRFDDGGLVGDVFTKKVYIIRLSGGDWFEDYNSVYDKYEDALNDYNKINNSDFERYENSKGLLKTLSEKTLKYKFVAEIDEDDNIDDYTDTITLKNKTFWQIIDDGEWNDLEADSVERINEKADKLLSEVYNYYGRKYNTIYLDEDETISLKLRIADHSGKWKNKGSEDYFLSIVISDKNPTEDFYMNSSEGLNREQEEVFSSENTFEEIIEFINEKIKLYKEISKYSEGGMPKKEIFNSIGSAIGFGTIPIIEGHDMVAECDCGEKFTYQNSKKDILWQCPKCNVKKGF